MSKKEEYLENFKAAITSTAKSLSNSNEINISFGGQITKSEKNLINLPDIENINKKINFDEIRALADSKSLKIRFSNKTTLEKISKNFTKKEFLNLILKVVKTKL